MASFNQTRMAVLQCIEALEKRLGLLRPEGSSLAVAFAMQPLTHEQVQVELHRMLDEVQDSLDALKARDEQKAREPEKCSSCGRTGSVGSCWWCAEERAYDED